MFFCIYAEPGGPPQEVLVTKINSTSYRVTWKPVRNDMRNGIITKYQIRLTLVKQRTTVFSNQSIDYVSSQAPLQYVFHGLTLCSQYTVDVRGFTKIGAGPYSKPVAILTQSRS